MNWLLIIGIIIIVVLIISLFFHFIKLALKTLGSIILVVIMIFVILGILSYFNALHFQENFGVSDNLYLLRDNETILAGFILNNSDPEDTTFLQSDEIIDYQEKLDEKEYEEVLGENYKLFIVEMQVLENASVESFNKEGVLVSKEYAIALLRSNTPMDSFAEKMAVEKSISKEMALSALKEGGIERDDVLKDQIFLIFMSNEFSDDAGMEAIINLLKDSKMYIYPRKVLFTMINFIPGGIIDKLTAN